ncbi:MAG: fibronectin type III domain-containing protein, partial [Oscillospiraceae bacterium]|nr:fibronectin type III domain-containing protein [Oscillospiraceae bacterium]
VTKGSPAEKWAKANKVKYTYAGSSSSSGSAAAPSNIKASKTNNSVTLSWDKADGADIYRVYKYNDKTGKYEKYKDVTSAKCTVSGLSANTKYKFKVVSYSKNKDGKYVKGESSKAVSVTTTK